MKNKYSFLFYKLYRFAKAQEETVNPVFGFLSLVSIFEILHFAIIAVSFKIFGININLGGKNIFVVLFILFGYSINYFIFIKSKLIYRLNDYFNLKKYSVWKGKLLFFFYILILFLIMIFQAMYYQKYIKIK